jgi:hypothetical protein
MPNKIDLKKFNGKFESAVNLETLLAANDGKLPDEIPVLPKGEFMTMPYGNMVLDDKVFEDMIANFGRQVRRATPVDVDHAMNGETKAAGWIKNLINKADGLWAAVKWNKLGIELVGEEIYKMISAEWSFDYVDPQKSTHHGAVLVAATLTNRPLMQSMPTITASDKDLTNPHGLVILFSNDSKTAKTMPTLEDILKKPVAERTEDDLKFLKENEADLSDEQKTQIETEVSDAAKAKEEADAAALKVKEEGEAEAKTEAEAGNTEACEKALVKAGKTVEEAKTAAETMVADAKLAKENVTITAAELGRLQKIESDAKASEVTKAAETFIAPFMASEKGGKVLPVGKESLQKLVASLNEEQRTLLASVLNATAEQTITKAAGEDANEGLTATEQYTKFISEYKAEHKDATPTQLKNAFKAKYPEVAKAYDVETK